MLAAYNTIQASLQAPAQAQAPNVVILHLSVPPTVKKIALTEQGVVDSGENAPYKFSFGQVIFPSSGK
jgi:hypothetical protein